MAARPQFFGHDPRFFLLLQTARNVRLQRMLARTSAALAAGPNPWTPCNAHKPTTDMAPLLARRDAARSAASGTATVSAARAGHRPLPGSRRPGGGGGGPVAP